MGLRCMVNQTSENTDLAGAHIVITIINKVVSYVKWYPLRGLGGQDEKDQELGHTDRKKICRFK